VFWILICCFLCYRVLLTFYSVILQYAAVRSLDRQSVINFSSNGIPSFVHCSVLRNGNHCSSKKLWWSVQILGVQIRSTPQWLRPWRVRDSDSYCRLLQTIVHMYRWMLQQWLRYSLHLEQPSSSTVHYEMLRFLTSLRVCPEEHWNYCRLQLLRCGLRLLLCF